jgi:EthD domain
VEKVVYVVRGPATEGSSDLVDVVGPALVGAGGCDIEVHAVDHGADAAYRGGSGVDVGTSAGTEVIVRGVVTCWLDSIDDVGPIDDVIRTGRLAHGYLVTESVPKRMVRARTGARIGEATPGIAMVTVLDKPDRLSNEEFLRRWTTDHTPLSLAWLPLVGYVRNHVARALQPDAPQVSGIVVEHFAELADVLDPARFLSAVGDPALLAERQRVTADDVAAFLDLDRVEVHMMREHLFGS